MPIHNVHMHTFTSRHVPSEFLPLGLMHAVRTGPGGKVTSWVLRHVQPLKRYDRFDRLAAFTAIGNRPSQTSIFEFVMSFYPQDTRFVALSMDMDFMGAGTAPVPYVGQIQELAALKSRYPNELRPFVAADPRRNGVADLVKEYIEQHGFAGIKLYPPLGFWPFDARLDPVYEYAQRKEIPITAHCSPGGVHYMGKITDAMPTDPRSGTPLSSASGDELPQLYAHPANYREVLRRFPRLKLCFAHFGGGREWQRHLRDPWRPGNTQSWLGEILNLLREPQWPNLFADVSSTAADPNNLALMKVLIEDPQIGPRVLYGSDYYMVQREVTEREFSVNFRAFVGEANWDKVAVQNPTRFLR